MAWNENLQQWDDYHLKPSILGYHVYFGKTDIGFAYTKSEAGKICRQHKKENSHE